MSSVDAYRRQTRSVDDDEEDDDNVGKDNFIYKRMSESDLQEGKVSYSAFRFTAASSSSGIFLMCGLE